MQTCKRDAEGNKYVQNSLWYIEENKSRGETFLLNYYIVEDLFI